MMKHFLASLLSVTLLVSVTQAQEDVSETIQSYKNMNLAQYHISQLKKEISFKADGGHVRLVSVEKMNFLPQATMYEQKTRWAKAGILWPDMIVLAKGRYDLESIYKDLHNDKIIQKQGPHTYLIKRPIYISATASLFLKDIDLRLSIEHGTYIIYHGGLDVVDSTITSWDIKSKTYGKRKHIADNKLLFYLEQESRPYIFGLEGSVTKMVSSNIVGLGYKGQTGCFGISLAKSIGEVRMGSIKSLLRKRKKPEGIFVGNDISKCFFGFYTNNANKVILLGNVLHDNVIYNFDPHDYSQNLLIAKNISYKAGHAHGIIISREVHDSVIAENISFSNAGSGVMLDRNCEDNLIYKNLCFLNKGDGISIYESSHNLITKNVLVKNTNNGLFVRNSKKILVNDNVFFANGNNGAEIAVVNIDSLETRNFVLDPYSKYAQANFLNNAFESNINSALSVKNKANFFFKENSLKNSGPVYFSGEIENISHEIMIENKNNGFTYKNTKGQVK